MPKTLPREERAPVENYNAGLLTDLSTRISSEVQGLQELVLEVDGEQELGATPTLDLNLEVHPGRKRKRAGPAKYNSGFDLAAIQQALDKFAAEPADRLELEPYSKTQRKQVAALAKLYGLEARACGRAGQTFFRTAETRPLDADGQAQVKRLLACSFRPPKPKKPRHAYSEPTESAPAAPVPDSNIGNQLLRGLGWRDGQGLGVTQSGIIEPLIPEQRRGRRGLGCE